jgi:hypothetical protein
MIWHTQNFISHKWLIESIKLRLTDQFKQNWHSTLQISPKALSYRLFKSDFRFEKYLDVLNDLIFLFIISISLHNLRTVSGFFLLNNDDSF